ncbi:MAG: urea carboxylase-associated family protein [Candidatus Rokubacteria bacterium]|nr:urea carboxylase-associated family protein [Candidatus Rokubacteria bacterium]
MAKPRVIYARQPGTPVDADREFYRRLASETDTRTPVDSFIVPIRSGKAWPVRAGQLCRIVVVEGPQVADFNAWNLHNPRERFWAARTKQLHRSHVTTYDRLWSCLPYLRPMLTITNDTVNYGIDEDGAGCHDLLGTRCDPYVHKLLNGEEFDYCCHSNLVRAVVPYGLSESDVHDVLNIFMVTGLTRDGRYFVKPSPARKGDFFEFFAEIDLLCAFSTCPHGDLSVAMWGPDAADPTSTCRPLGVDVYQPAPTLLEGWRPPQPVDYRGLHGFRLP